MIRQYNVAYFMASVDSLEDNTVFAEMNAANFPILADPTKKMAEAYGVLSAGGFAKRWAFYINLNGEIEYIDQNVKPGTAGVDMAAHLARLGFPLAGSD